MQLSSQSMNFTPYDIQNCDYIGDVRGHGKLHGGKR